MFRISSRSSRFKNVKELHFLIHALLKEGSCNGKIESTFFHSLLFGTMPAPPSFCGPTMRCRTIRSRSAVVEGSSCAGWAIRTPWSQSLTLELGVNSYLFDKIRVALTGAYGSHFGNELHWLVSRTPAGSCPPRSGQQDRVRLGRVLSTSAQARPQHRLCLPTWSILRQRQRFIGHTGLSEVIADYVVDIWSFGLGFDRRLRCHTAQLCYRASSASFLVLDTR